jgi:hypothetical protein
MASRGTQQARQDLVEIQKLIDQFRSELGIGRGQASRGNGKRGGLFRRARGRAPLA